MTSENSEDATTTAASATSPNEAAIPDATLESASASEDGFNSLGSAAVEVVTSSSANEEEPMFSMETLSSFLLVDVDVVPTLVP